MVYIKSPNGHQNSKHLSPLPPPPSPLLCPHPSLPLSSAPPPSSHSLMFSRRLCLVYEAISLVFRISISDNYFDTHRDPCEHMYAFVFNRLAVLMESCQPPREGTYVRTYESVLTMIISPADYVSMVNELLSYCEELDDSS